MAAKITDMDTIIAMGFDPKTGLPRKFVQNGKNLRTQMLRQLRIKDEQEFVNSIIPHTPGLNMSDQEFMRMVYYYPNLAIFVLNDRPYLMPYALDGGLDFYNRANTIHPVPLTQGDAEMNPEQKKALREVLASHKKKVLYEPTILEDGEDPSDYAILIRDYTPQRSLNNISRAEIDDAILNYEADMFQYMRTSGMMGSGVRGVRVSDPDGSEAVISASNAIDAAALNAQCFIPMLSRMEFQDLSQSGTYRTQDYMLAIQGLDNFRKQCLGIDDAAMFDKKAYVNETQSQTGITHTETLKDRYKQLQNAFNIFNSIWGTEWYVEYDQDLTEEVGDVGEEGGKTDVDATSDEQQDVQ